LNTSIIIQECSFKAVRSSGAGGQHVNKVSSKIELSFNILISNGLTGREKSLLEKKLQNRLSKNNNIILQCSESRSQHKNKELVIKKLLYLIKNNLVIPKKRIPTKIPKSVIRKRLKNKKQQSDKKINRKRPSVD